MVKKLTLLILLCSYLITQCSKESQPYDFQNLKQYISLNAITNFLKTGLYNKNYATRYTRDDGATVVLSYNKVGLILDTLFYTLYLKAPHLDTFAYCGWWASFIGIRGLTYKTSNLKDFFALLFVKLGQRYVFKTALTNSDEKKTLKASSWLWPYKSSDAKRIAAYYSLCSSIAQYLEVAAYTGTLLPWSYEDASTDSAADEKITPDDRKIVL